jgi:carboxyl-terminal processing protease
MDDLSFADRRRRRQINVWTPLAAALILILGMTLGFRLHNTLRNKRDFTTVIERNDRLDELIDLIRERYVDSVNSDALYRDAVQGILSHLDPHTTYIPAEELTGMNEELEGSFFGIGVEFNIIDDTIHFTSVVERGPAERSGIAPGDALIRVGDSTVAGVGITSERIMSMLRGAQKSRVKVTIKEGTTGQIKPVVITRDAIPIYSVEAQLMLDATTGYIKINRFAETTYEEFVDAVTALRKRGMKSLILDLRQNPGGYLERAAAIADEFIAGEQLLVYTKGRASERTEYRTDHRGIFEEGHLAVLVDEGSASAAEILAAAIQDLDRGVVVGRRTFGKGLVQEQYDLADGSALRLTTARYYTPSGRSIQRPFAAGRKAYEEEYEHRFETGELTGMAADTVLTQEDTTRYYTSRRRVVYGGAGVMPDVVVPYDTALLNTSLLNAVYGEELKAAIWHYYTSHRAELRSYRGVADFTQRFAGTGEIMRTYLASLSPAERAAAMRVLARPVQRAYFMTQVQASLARILFRANGYYAIALRSDAVVRRAREVLAAPRYSQLIRR